MNNSITFVATGDSFITRRLPSKDESFKMLSSLICSADVRFTNLEVTTHHLEGTPSAVSGGTWAVAHPDVLKDLKAYGFNVLAWANNHTLDYSYDGLAATEKYLNQYDFIHAGAGSNLANASQPKYLETPSGRVALISVTSTFHESWIAGEQRPDMIGRPGINPLRHNTLHVISREKMKHLQDIAEIVNVNGFYNKGIEVGLVKRLNEGLFPFGRLIFQEGEQEGRYTKPHKKDLNRILSSISEAKRQADYIIVSIHNHEVKGDTLDEPADFIKTFSRACIDEGAHAIIGHGPHVIRGIEIYRNCPIFYSLGNFIFQNETITHLPSDFYEKYGLDHNHNVADALDARSYMNTRGFSAYPDAWVSVLPLWSMIEGKLSQLTLYPIDLGQEIHRYKRGWPKISQNEDILRKLSKLSVPFNTILKIENGIGKVVLS
ncbi:CapA family protein [Brevibacillus daliensis]|uniref:CapA family protein n=1 Tax=Brevibacillus daliensis TaxID=2892995 RepID=UPI001E578FC3|nr:CapA family protein [Brevibacillus daliensis]